MIFVVVVGGCLSPVVLVVVVVVATVISKVIRLVAVVRYS